MNEAVEKERRAALIKIAAACVGIASLFLVTCFLPTASHGHSRNAGVGTMVREYPKAFTGRHGSLAGDTSFLEPGVCLEFLGKSVSIQNSGTDVGQWENGRLRRVKVLTGPEAGLVGYVKEDDLTTCDCN